MDISDCFVFPEDIFFRIRESLIDCSVLLVEPKSVETNSGGSYVC